MTLIDAKGRDYAALNQALRAGGGECRVTNCLGQRFIGVGLAHKQITVAGIPGNALGAYLNGAGMHSGKMFIRSACEEVRFPKQVACHRALPEDLAEAEGAIKDFCRIFNLDAGSVLDAPFTVVTPNSANPYKQMYVAN